MIDSVVAGDTCQVRDQVLHGPVGARGHPGVQLLGGQRLRRLGHPRPRRGVQVGTLGRVRGGTSPGVSLKP